MSEEPFLSRWSRLKKVARAEPQPVPPAPAEPGALPAVGERSGVAAEAPAPQGEVEAPAPLPDLDTLTPQSDFSPFMNAQVDPATRRQALKTLFADPQFNVMDGLDVYIDDYSKPDPLPEGWLAKLNQLERLGHYIEPEEAPAEGTMVAATDPAETAAPHAAGTPQRLASSDGAEAPAPAAQPGETGEIEGRK